VPIETVIDLTHSPALGAGAELCFRATTTARDESALLRISRPRRFRGQIFVNDSLKTALTRYRLDVGDYPTTAEGLAALMTAPAHAADRWHGPYADMPGGKLPLDPWGEPYQYRNPGVKNKGGYDLYSKGPDRLDGTEDDIGNW